MVNASIARHSVQLKIKLLPPWPGVCFHEPSLDLANVNEQNSPLTCLSPWVYFVIAS